MSTLKLDTLISRAREVAGTTPSSITAPYLIMGSSKIWTQFTSITTTTIDQSFNVTSLTDGGTGITTVNITSAMSASKYALSAMVRSISVVSIVIPDYNAIPAAATTSISVRSINQASTGYDTDFGIIAQGSLA